MMGISYGVGTPTSSFAQTLPTSPFGGYASGANLFGAQAQHYLQQQQQHQILQHLLQVVPQQLQQLLHLVPQQIQQLQNVQQQIHQLQQVIHILPQQLQQLQQVVQHLPQLLHQTTASAAQPFGNIPSPNVTPFGAGVSPHASSPWGFTTASQGVPFGYGQPAGIPAQNFGYGAFPTQLM